MTQKIDPAKLKAAAERLEWVCQQYPNEKRVQGLLESMRPLIEDAKAGRVHAPIADRHDIPARWAVSGEGLYRDYKDPDVENAYVAFAIEMEGGLSQDDLDINAIIENIRKGTGSGGRS